MGDHMNKIFLAVVASLLLPGLASAANITYADKVSGGSFSAADANEIKTAVNSKANLAAITWVTATAYTANNQSVTHGGHVFVCISSHTSGSSTEPGTGVDWATVWKYHGSDLYAATLTADENYLSNAEKTRIGQLESTDVPVFAGADLGVASTTTGLLRFYGNAKAFSFGLWSQGADGTGIGWRLPSAMATGDSVIGVDTNGYLSYLPSTAIVASGFNGNLLTTDDTVQELADAVDNLVITGTDDQTAAEVNITDAGTYYTGTTVEAALQEVGSDIASFPTLTIQTSAITTGANNILGSDYGLIADTDGDGLPNKVDLAAAGTVQVDSNGVVSSVAFASSSDINTGTDTTKPVTADALSGSNLGIEPVGWMIKNSATATAVADGTEAFVVPAAMNGRNLVDVTAATASPNGGTGGSTTVVIRRVRTTAAMGDATSQYDLTFSTPNVTITWDGTGTDPGIVNTAASLQAGDEVDITGFATAANNGHWTIATVGTNYITFANAAGVENLDDIGVTITPTKHRDMTSTGATVAYTEYSASDETVDTGYDDIATGDRIYVDVTGITTTAGAKGLSVTSSFQLP